MIRLFTCACLVILLKGEIIDRLAITVGQQAITDLQLDEELRVTALLNGQPVIRNPEARRAAADRLIQQVLIRREMDLSRYPLPGPNDVRDYLTKIQSASGGAVRFNKALSDYHLTERILERHLATQLTTLRFIEYRFRPDVSVSESDIQAYYLRQVSAWSVSHAGRPPNLESSKESIKQAIIAQRTDEALDNWLEESRKQTSIVYIEKALQ